MSFTTAGLRRGYVAAQPLALGVFVYAVTFGLLARATGLSIIEATLMSATAYSGSAQTATVSMMAAGASIGACVATILMLNARYLLYGAALRPWLGTAASPAQAYATLYFLGDSNWVLAMKAHADGEHDAGFVFGSGIAMFIPWVGGTVVGALATGLVADPKRLALDFLLVGFCMAMGTGLAKSRQEVWPAGAAVLVAILVDRLAPGGWTIVAAGLAGAAVAFLRAEDPA